jgi:hypothetical protein
MLSLRLDSALWVRWQLKNRRLLSLIQERQQQDLAVWEFKRVVVDEALVFVDLAKDGGAMLCCAATPAKQAKRQPLHWLGKGQLSSRPQADRQVRVFRCSKSAGARPKVAGDKSVTNARWPRFDIVKAVVTHLGPPIWEKPLSQYQLSHFSGPAHQQ